METIPSRHILISISNLFPQFITTPPNLQIQKHFLTGVNSS